MKSRTIIGIFCILLSVGLILVAVPWLSAKEEDTVPAVCARVNIARGTKITEKMLEVVQVRKEDRRENTLTVLSGAVGNYAGCDIFAGDRLTQEKIKAEANAVSDVLYRLQDGEYAVTVSFASATKGFSGQLENGDIVKIYLDGGASGLFSPKELQYLRVITTLTQNGESRDSAKVGGKEEEQEKAASVMFAVRDIQAELLLPNAANNKAFCAFVCHGSDPRAEQYLAAQEIILREAEEARAEAFDGSDVFPGEEAHTYGN